MSASPISLPAGAWEVDPSHSSVSFTARHLMVSKVRGSFALFSGSITVGSDPLASSVEATVDASSVSTGSDGRDAHLRSPEFFDVERFPTWSFRSTSLRQVDGGEFVLEGDLTIKGTTRPVVFELEFDGVATDPWGNTKAGFSASAEISRKDFGLEWNVALEAGGVLVGDRVKVVLDIQAKKL